MDNWQPIETAPRDGSWVLGHSSENAHEDVVYVMEWFERDGWLKVYHDCSAHPTHWQPLPAPPKDNQ